MTVVVALLGVMLGVAPPVPQDAPTIETLRARAQERMRQDQAIYSREDCAPSRSSTSPPTVT